MNLMAIFLIGISLLWLLGALVGALERRIVWLSLSLALLGSLFAAGFSATVWLKSPLLDESVQFHLDLWRELDNSSMLPELLLEFGLDALSAFFTFLVSVFSALVAVYSFRALEADHYRPYRHWIASAFNLFCWSTVLVFAARDGFSLIITLELMTLSFGYLVLYKHFLSQDLPDKFDIEHQYRYRLAPQVYLMISHTSTVFLVLAVLILSIKAGSINFIVWMEKRSALQGIPLVVTFLLVLTGLGIRAGLTPAHIWVSLVHPSSPTTTHALSLGIAIKVAIYLMYRFFFQFLSPTEWWGYLLLTTAVITAFMNVWYAISSHDLKEALAYHSIENIGIICAGIGLGLIFWQRAQALAYLGLLASLYHLLNHAVFKGLLYLATGAIDNFTHQQVEIDKLGGLIHRYRFTASMFLVGSFAIAGFPPLNGFISEWLMLKTGLKGLQTLSTSTTILEFVGVLLSLLLLVASFALTAFCFYKLAGVALLGAPRLPESDRKGWEKNDVHFSMKAVMGTMAILCLLLGILPSLVAPQLVYALQPLGVPKNYAENIDWDLLSLTKENASPVSQNLPIIIYLLLAVGLLLLFLVQFPKWVFPIPARRISTPWNCGEPVPKLPFHQFSSGGLSYSLRKVFSFLNPSPSEVPQYLPSQFPLSKSDRNPQQVVEIFRLAYNWVIDYLLRASQRFSEWLQNGDIRRYMTYVFLINLLMLILYWVTSLLIE